MFKATYFRAKYFSADFFPGGGGGATTEQFTVSGRSVQDLFTPSALSYPSHVTRQTN
jgi:hypothetical protein